MAMLRTLIATAWLFAVLATTAESARLKFKDGLHVNKHEARWENCMDNLYNKVECQRHPSECRWCPPDGEDMSTWVCKPVSILDDTRCPENLVDPTEKDLSSAPESIKGLLALLKDIDEDSSQDFDDFSDRKFFDVLRYYVQIFREEADEKQRSDFDSTWELLEFGGVKYSSIFDEARNGGSALLAVAELMINSLEARSKATKEDPSGLKQEFSVPTVDGQTPDPSKASGMTVNVVDENGCGGFAGYNQLFERQAGTFPNTYIMLKGFLHGRSALYEPLFELQINKPRYPGQTVPYWAWRALQMLYSRHP